MNGLLICRASMMTMTTRNLLLMKYDLRESSTKSQDESMNSDSDIEVVATVIVLD